MLEAETSPLADDCEIVLAVETTSTSPLVKIVEAEPRRASTFFTTTDTATAASRDVLAPGSLPEPGLAPAKAFVSVLVVAVAATRTESERPVPSNVTLSSMTAFVFSAMTALMEIPAPRPKPPSSPPPLSSSSPPPSESWNKVPSL